MQQQREKFYIEVKIKKCERFGKAFKLEDNNGNDVVGLVSSNRDVLENKLPVQLYQIDNQIAVDSLTK